MARPGKGMRYFVPPAGPPRPQLSSSERQEIEGFALPQLSSPECAEIEEFAKLRLPHYGPPIHFGRHDWLRIEVARSDYAVLRPREMTERVVWGSEVAKLARVFITNNAKYTAAAHRYTASQGQKEPAVPILVSLIGGYRRRREVNEIEAAKLVIEQHERDLASGVTISDSFDGLVCDLGHVVHRTGGSWSVSGSLADRNPSIAIQSPFVRLVWSIMQTMPKDLRQHCAAKETAGKTMSKAIERSLKLVEPLLPQGNCRRLRFTPLNMLPDSRRDPGSDARFRELKKSESP